MSYTTDTGTVYCISAPRLGYCKVGFTIGSVTTRLKTLQAGCPVPLEVVARWPGGLLDEREVHYWLRRLGCAVSPELPKHEWFDIGSWEELRETDGLSAMDVAARFAALYRRYMREDYPGMCELVEA